QRVVSWIELRGRTGILFSMFANKAEVYHLDRAEFSETTLIPDLGSASGGKRQTGPETPRPEARRFISS
ncbi:MAG TPA: hypothetical protein VLQ45_19380, partial [Thermoanaerobaculia bacterium]|nr:hypothetical protein [Thermoanaerobaculia bacterium]